MADQGFQVVLRCTLCNKPFDKHSTLKRHGYYCRSRNNIAKPKRLRSCIACVKAKARCDNGLPSCSRCAARNAECRAQIDSIPELLSSRNSGRKSRKTQPLEKRIPADTSQPLLDVSTLLDEIEQAPLDMNFTDLGSEHFEWNTIDMDIPDFQELNNQLVVQNPLQSHITHAVNHSELADDGANQFGYGTLTMNLPASIPTTPTYHLRSFAQRPSIRGRRQTTATLMVNILTSYLMMMRSPDTLPPFIHPYSLQREVEMEIELSGSLTTCMSLMQMISTNVPGSRRLLWKNVRLECERLQHEWRSFDRWELLSSMQALLVYILLRLQEGETMDNNFDVLLLATAWTVAKGLNQAIGNIPCDRPCGVDLGVDREAWIFEESRRRLAVTFGTVCMLIYMEPCSDCVQYEGFLLTPLPARKQLWEARDEGSWGLEKSRDAGSSTMFGIMMDGQMAKLNETHAQAFLSRGFISMEPISSTESSANWQEWCSGMDGLGALIMLAASLPSLHS